MGKVEGLAVVSDVLLEIGETEEVSGIISRARNGAVYLTDVWHKHLGVSVGNCTRLVIHDAHEWKNPGPMIIVILLLSTLRVDIFALFGTVMHHISFLPTFMVFYLEATLAKLAFIFTTLQIVALEKDQGRCIHTGWQTIVGDNIPVGN